MAVVTGSSSGIGRAIALALAAAGATWSFMRAHNRAGAEETAALAAAARRASPRVLLAIWPTPARMPPLVERGLELARRGGHLGQQRRRRRAHRRGRGLELRRKSSTPVASRRRRHDRALAATSARGCKHAARGAIINIGWDQAECGMAGDSGELFAAVKGRRDGLHPQPGPLAGARSARQLRGAGWIKTKWGDGASRSWQQRAVGESLLGALGHARGRGRRGPLSGVARRPPSSPARSFPSTAVSSTRS